MDREKFKERTQTIKTMDSAYMTRAMRNGAYYMDGRPIEKYHGAKNFLIYIEEINELTHEITKRLTNPEAEKTGLLEELADVWAGTQIAMCILNPDYTVESNPRTSGSSMLHPGREIELFLLQKNGFLGQVTAALNMLDSLSFLGQIMCKALRERPDEAQTQTLLSELDDILHQIENYALVEGFSYGELMTAVSVKLERMEKNTQPDSIYV